MQKYSTPLNIREMKINTTMTHNTLYFLIHLCN